jgi:hypothetical protein
LAAGGVVVMPIVRFCGPEIYPVLPHQLTGHLTEQ